MNVLYATLKDFLKINALRNIETDTSMLELSLKSIYHEKRQFLIFSLKCIWFKILYCFQVYNIVIQ